MDDEVLERAVLAGVLEVDGGGVAGVEALHGAAEQLEGEREVEHLDGLQLGELRDLALGDEEHICISARVRPSSSCTMGMSA